MSKGIRQRESDETEYEKGHDRIFADPIRREECAYFEAYQGIFRPRCGCRACWTLYRRMQHAIQGR